MRREEFEPIEDEHAGTFAVLCVLCGTKMRESKSEDILGQCWKCFYRTLNDHLRGQKRTQQPLFASDR